MAIGAHPPSSLDAARSVFASLAEADGAYQDAGEVDVPGKPSAVEKPGTLGLAPLVSRHSACLVPPSTSASDAGEDGAVEAAADSRDAAAARLDVRLLVRKRDPDDNDADLSSHAPTNERKTAAVANKAAAANKRRKLRAARE